MEDAISVIGERAPREAQLALATVKIALRNARDRGQAVDPGLLATSAPEGDEREPIFLTWKQVLELASWMPEQISRTVPVAALTGGREGELFALRAEDVDFADETLLVVTTGSNRRGQTKTRGSLARWRTSGGLVFPAPEGGIWNKDNFSRACSGPRSGWRQRSTAASTSSGVTSRARLMA
jgi:integrase